MTIFGVKMKEKGVTMYQLARETGIPACTLYNWARGSHRPQGWSGEMEKVVQEAYAHGVKLSYSDFITEGGADVNL